MTIFGITGGSGCGKTSASAMLSRMGVHIIDTDVIAHQITEKGERCLSELSEHFGSDILNADGTLDRKKLAETAFSNEENKSALNRITHKHIKARVEDEISSSAADIIAIDGAVIIGSCIEPLCEFIVSVLADRSKRMERIMARDGITEEAAALRLDAQPSDEFYKANSRYIIYNNGTAQELQKEVSELYKKIKGA